jgi:hypothetical protein
MLREFLSPSQAPLSLGPDGTLRPQPRAPPAAQPQPHPSQHLHPQPHRDRHSQGGQAQQAPGGAGGGAGVGSRGCGAGEGGDDDAAAVGPSQAGAVRYRPPSSSGRPPAPQHAGPLGPLGPPWPEQAQSFLGGWPGGLGPEGPVGPGRGPRPGGARQVHHSQSRGPPLSPVSSPFAVEPHSRSSDAAQLSRASSPQPAAGGGEGSFGTEALSPFGSLPTNPSPTPVPIGSLHGCGPAAGAAGSQQLRHR